MENPRLHAILDYISSAWNVLTRSTTTCTGVADNKLTEASLLYLPADLPLNSVIESIPKRCDLHVEHLPVLITGPGQVKEKAIQPPGLLYLEHPYVVPGGRFNEMYGWDSYFILRGLLRDGQVDLARGMVENFFFEIEHYGAVLNANRTYYLTRSQPPFLTSMIMAVYEAEKTRGHADRAWLANAYKYAEKDYEMWVSGHPFSGNDRPLALLRLWQRPVPEGLHDEISYYHDVLAYFLKHNPHSSYLVESDKPGALPHPEYAVKVCADRDAAADDSNCQHVKYIALSPDYYKGDRSMRESGFDISFRFGPYGADTEHFAPVCLNSLLYKTETDMEQISAWLGKKRESIKWQRRAQQRRRIIQKLIWNQQKGLFFDYDFKSRKQSSYVYATTFYPLWTGVATRAQAQAVVKNLNLFEHEGGLAMSTQDTGVQWDYPYGWAPIQLLAVEGLRRYGYDAEADRISYKFLSMVLVNFERDGNLREKYNVVTDSSNVDLTEGYRGNIIGFGWTERCFSRATTRIECEVDRPDWRGSAFAAVIASEN